MIYFFLHLAHNRAQSASRKLLKIDYIGNLVLSGSTVSVLYALSYGGTTYMWSDGRIISSLVIGLLGFVLFSWYETTSENPVVPPSLFQDLTAVIIFIAVFFNSLLLYWFLFFLPLYFQAVLGASGARAGVLLLPAILFGIPGAIVAVLLLSKTGKYKLIHVLGFAVTVLGCGLFSLLDENTSLAKVVIFQAVSAAGGGMVLNTLLPAVQAQLPESQQAAVTATFAYMRSLGSIWGVSIPGSIFSNRFARLLEQGVSDTNVRAQFEGGSRAYEHGYAIFIQALPEPAQSQVIGVYVRSLRFMWLIAIAFAGVNFAIVFFEKQTMLRTELDTEFGMERKKKSNVKLGTKEVRGKNRDGEMSGASDDVTTPVVGRV